jgi:hypothetical protein
VSRRHIRLERKHNISDTRNERNTCEHNLGLPSMLPLKACCIRRGSNHRRASLTTYLFLFSMITKFWSGFSRQPQKDHGYEEYLHFQFVLSIEVVCCFVSCFVLCCAVLCCVVLCCVIFCRTESRVTLPVLIQKDNIIIWLLLKLEGVSIQVGCKIAVSFKKIMLTRNSLKNMTTSNHRIPEEHAIQNR